MKIIITEPISGKIINLQLSDDTEIFTLQLLIEEDMKIPPSKQVLMYHSKLLNTYGNKTLKDYDVEDNSVIVLNKLQDMPSIDNSKNLLSRSNLELTNQINVLLQKAKADSTFCETLARTEPLLAKAVRSNNRENIKLELLKISENKKKLQLLEANKLLQATRNPLDPESQSLFLHHIQQQQIDESYLRAQEYLPESFASVSMLFVRIEVNQIKLKAFIDSGAQSTIISQKCAENCGLMKLVDKRFHGVAKGVGSSKIIGQIHLVQIKMGNTFFAASVIVLEDNSVDFLFGLDLLRRYQCIIDLKKNVLKIENEELPFLSEREASNINILSLEDRSNRDIKNTTDLNNNKSTESTSTNIETSIKESNIQKLISLGHNRNEAEKALFEANGDVEIAAAMLFKFFS